MLMLEDITLILYFDCSLNLSYIVLYANIYFITLLFQAYSIWWKQKSVSVIGQHEKNQTEFKSLKVHLCNN